MVPRLGLSCLLAATALTLPPGVPLHAAAGPSTAPLRAVAQHGGLRLEVTVPRSDYPRDALIRVRVVARNTTGHTLWIEGGGAQAPGRYLPQVEVLDHAGRPLPLSLTTYFPYPGPAPTAASLTPGATIGGPEDVVLRGSWVRARVTLLRAGNIPVRAGYGLTTRPLRVHLLPSDSPKVTINAGTGGPSVTIVRPPGLRGPPQAVWYADCGGTNFDQRMYWSSVSTVLVPGCSPLHAWHVLVGWRGHSVAAIDYPGD